jgi:acyl carrier protein
MTEEEVFESVRDAIRVRFGAPKASINRTTVAADIAGWDSVNHAALLMELEVMLGKELPVEDLFSVANVGDLCAQIAGVVA